MVDGFYLKRGKSLKTNVVENIKYYFDVDIKVEEIKHVSRFGSSELGEIPHSLRIKFHDPDFKNKLMSLKGKLKGTEVFIREHLTAHQLDVYTQAKLAEKNKILHNVCS